MSVPVANANHGDHNCNVRAPGDDPPYDAQCAADDEREWEERCIGCLYSQRYEEADTIQRSLSIDESEQRVIYNEMIDLIESHYSKGTSNRELVEMVYQFYNSEIRAHWDYGEWTRKSIWNHIMHHSNNERVQTTEMRANLVFQIEGLRNHAWRRKRIAPDDDVAALRSDFDGMDVIDASADTTVRGAKKNKKSAMSVDGEDAKFVLEPDYRTIRLMSELMKTHNLLQDSQYRRTAQQSNTNA
eukprot:gene5174-6294_t